MKCLCGSSACALVLVAGLGISAVVAGGWAQQPADKKPAPPAPAAQPPAAAPAADPNDMMQMMQQIAAPGPEHEMLKQFAGKWNGTIETFGEGAQKSTGVMTNSWVLGGRFLRQEWKGEFFGQPFEGLGYWGFDRVKKQWFGAWMDTWGTGMMVSTGTYDAAKKTWTLVGSTPNPVTGQDEKMKETIVVNSPDMHTMEMFGEQDGKEELMMRIVYTRAK